MSMQTGLMIAAVPYALIGLAGWRNNRILRRREAAAQPAPEAVPASSEYTLGKAPLAVETLQVQAALADAVRALDAEAARHMTRLTLAVTPGLALRADPAALRSALFDLLGAAIRRSPCGEVLVCAGLHGGRVQVSVADEGAGTALDTLSETTRGIVALHGGTLEAQGMPGSALLVLRLPAPPDVARKQAAHPAAAPAPQRAGVQAAADGRHAVTAA